MLLLFQNLVASFCRGVCEFVQTPLLIHSSQHSICSQHPECLGNHQTAACLPLHRNLTSPPSLWPGRELRKFHIPVPVFAKLGATQLSQDQSSRSLHWRSWRFAYCCSWFTGLYLMNDDSIYKVRGGKIFPLTLFAANEAVLPKEFSIPPNFQHFA